ncbi:MAG: BREX-1 system adenine-specific DNA-methyltransferase PglX [Gemmatales bacterium]|nr:BREX-1 system adenine-specific DNA-methyltransferase PglX [Gemmatales bacterium]MDW7993061.1 BREX-1 system adenine-specific DNA-methyltransferase PglX [Gemmatales bacterium]
MGVLFSPHDPANRLYPPQRALDQVLACLNDPALADVWHHDETLGWVYQYFTPTELRTQARQESRAPRNAYELAFRNQFYTPRYVVEFLVDNTLGRLWYEMRHGATRLTERCRYLVPDRSPSAWRPKKDPRLWKILDPACGSGHFLLYCFDLLLDIYDEAHDDPDLGPALRRDYPDKSALYRDLPRLILAENLYGLDIDPRAIQVAALALWLRCQRAYRQFGLSGERPKITRSHLVCAEPMPGERQLLREFVASLEPQLLGQLVEVVFDKMQLAGEAGPLLLIEDDLRDAVQEAHRQFLAGGGAWQRTMFDAPDSEPPRLFAVSALSDAQFFEQAEQRVVAALRAHAQRADNGRGLQRRLFAEDTAQGLAFVELCHQRYDVILMNPPYGDYPIALKAYLERAYPRSKHNLYAAFVEMALRRLLPDGLLGALTSRTGFFLSSFQKWREEVLLREARLLVVADLGYGVLDTAMVETAAYCLAKATPSAAPSAAPTVFFRMLHHENKAEALAQARAAYLADQPHPDVFPVAPEQFRLVPGSPFAYWVSERIRRLFRELPPFQSEGRTVRVGLQTADDFRFVRCWWEVDPQKILDARHGPDWRRDLKAFQQWCRQRTFEGKRWVPFAKGGEYSPFYADLHLVINWERDGEEIRNFRDPETGRPYSCLRNTDYYFRPGLTWSERTSKRFGPRVLNAGAIISVKGSGGFATNETDLWLALAFMNSSAFSCLVDLIVGTSMIAKSYEVGVLGIVPYPDLRKYSSILVAEAQKCYKFALYKNYDETAHEFTSYQTRPEPPSKPSQLIDDIIYEAYGLNEQERAQLEALSITVAVHNQGWFDDDNGDASDEKQLDDRAKRAREVISYAVGCVFGRWDVRYATGEKAAPPLPDPFDPLPVCPPGMLQGEDGLPLSETPPGYPLAIQWNGILVDDPEHTDDIVRRVRDVFDLLWGDAAEQVEQEACRALGVRDLREYFRRAGPGGFWHDHLARYSKSRRKAPIYWLLQSSKGNFALWLYYHQLDEDLLFKARLHYVEPKIRREENRLAALQQQKAQAAGNVSKRLDRDLERQQDLLSELRDFADKLQRAARLQLRPDRDDGVVLTIAHLWELVPWKEAKKYWDELLAGKYPWSSIAQQLRQKGLVRATP